MPNQPPLGSDHDRGIESSGYLRHDLREGRIRVEGELVAFADGLRTNERDWESGLAAE